MIIKKVYKNKTTGQLSVTVPKGEGISEGDHVKITKVEEVKEK